MSEVWERIKSVPPVLWIGALFVVVIAFVLMRQGGSSSAGAITAPSTSSPGTAGTDLSSLTAQLAANQTAEGASISKLQDSFNSGLKQMTDTENANNANTLGAITSAFQAMSQQTTQEMATLSQADAQRTAALQTGFGQQFQQLVTTQNAQAQSTAEALKAIATSVGSLGSAMTNLGSAMQTLRSQPASVGASVIYDAVGASNNGAAPIPGVASGPGGRNDQARSVAADSGSHAAIVNGQVTTINKPYAQMSDAERGAANAFAHQHPNGI